MRTGQRLKPANQGLATHTEAHGNDFSMEHPAPNVTKRSNGDLEIRGSELLGAIGLISAGLQVPAGAALMELPLSPVTWTASRVAQMAPLFDQYRIEALVLEYVPLVAATKDGGLAMATYPDPSDAPGLLTGDARLRSVMARDGAAMTNVWSKMSVHMLAPLLKWYNTALNEEDLSTSVPGLFSVITATAFDAPAEDQTFGMVWAHYIIAFRAPAVELGAIEAVTDDNVVVTFVALAADAVMYSSLANTPLAATFADEGVVVVATICGYTDATTAAWRNWEHPVNGDVYTITTGMVIYGRYVKTGASEQYIWYPSFSLAVGGEPSLSAGNPHDDAWHAATAGNGGTLRIAHAAGFAVTQ